MSKPSTMVLKFNVETIVISKFELKVTLTMKFNKFGWITSSVFFKFIYMENNGKRSEL